LGFERGGTAVADLGDDLCAMLEQAKREISGGDVAEGAARAKAVSALVRAERDVAEHLSQSRAAALEDDDEACRAELLRRLTLFADAARAGDSDEVLARIAATGVRN
jgi:hypothetical protein